jgi:hypothetical protein
MVGTCISKRKRRQKQEKHRVKEREREREREEHLVCGLACRWKDSGILHYMMLRPIDNHVGLTAGVQEFCFPGFPLFSLSVLILPCLSYSY